MTHTTDQIHQKIVSKAVSKERARLEEIIQRFQNELGILNNSITVTTPSGTWSTGLYFAELLNTLMDERSEEISDKAVTEFLSNYDVFCASQDPQS